MSVLCVNPNPAVDRVAVVKFARGGTLRPVRSFEWPGGSGVHAAHVARQLGASVEVLAPVGGDYGKRFTDLATTHSITVHAVENTAETRGTFTVLDVDEGNVCDIAELGGMADPGVGEVLFAQFQRRVEKAKVCVLSGSLLENLPVDMYARMVRASHAKGVPAIVDATGEALLAVTRSPVFLLKASLEELARDRVLGLGVPAHAVLDRARDWVASGVANVCLSLGSAGLIWVSSDSVALLASAPVEPYNTVGCGDALVGAVAASINTGESLVESLVKGVAAATANLAYDEPGHCTQADVLRLSGSVAISFDDEEVVCRAIMKSRPK